MTDRGFCDTFGRWTENGQVVNNPIRHEIRVPPISSVNMITTKTHMTWLLINPFSKAR